MIYVLITGQIWNDLIGSKTQNLSITYVLLLAISTYNPIFIAINTFLLTF